MGSGGKDSLRLAEAAAILELAPSTLRRYVKSGKLKATRAPGKYGEEYRIKPAVLKVFALETLGLSLEDSDFAELAMAGGVANTHQPLLKSSPIPSGERELYERLLAATEEATRYKAICDTSESTYKAQIAGLEAEIAALKARRRWWHRSRPEAPV